MELLIKGNANVGMQFNMKKPYICIDTSQNEI